MQIPRARSLWRNNAGEALRSLIDQHAVIEYTGGVNDAAERGAARIDDAGQIEERRGIGLGNGDCRTSCAHSFEAFFGGHTGRAPTKQNEVARSGFDES